MWTWALTCSPRRRSAIAALPNPPGQPNRPTGSSRPARVTARGWALSVGLGLLLSLGIIWLIAYFALGVTPTFIFGLIRARASAPRTAADVTAPPGVHVTVWAKDLTAPTSLTFGPDGRLYVAELAGQVLALADLNRDGSAETRVTFASGLNSPLGLAFFGADLYVGRRAGVTRLTDTNGDGVADQVVAIIDGLPALRHQTDGLAFGPDGRLYIGQGSTSDRGETPVYADTESSNSSPATDRSSRSLKMRLNRFNSQCAGTSPSNSTPLAL